MRDILIGCDPEVFCFDTKKGMYISSHDILYGTKASPFLVEDGAVQVDGVAAEFNIFPAKSEDEFVKNINSVMGQMLMITRSMNPDVEFRAEPTAFFDPAYFWNLPFETLQLGCEPDFNAYTGKENPKPKTEEPFRTGSFHVHVGFTSNANPHDASHFMLCREIVQRLDETLYPLSMAWDSDQKRRELYGQIGSFRPKHYGFEYRPLSNAVLRSEENIRRVYRTTIETVREFFHD